MYQDLMIYAHFEGQLPYHSDHLSCAHRPSDLTLDAFLDRSFKYLAVDVSGLAPDEQSFPSEMA